MQNKYGMLQYQEKKVKMIIHQWLNDLRQLPFYYMQLEAEVVIYLFYVCNDYTKPSKIIVKAVSCECVCVCVYYRYKITEYLLCMRQDASPKLC